MLTGDVTLSLELSYVDKEGRGAKTTVKLPFSTSYDMAISKGNAIASAIAPLTQAALVSIVVRYVYREDSPIAPHILSDVGYYLVLYYSNGVDTEPFYIPAPVDEHLETTGSFAGIRFDLGNPAVALLADALTNALTAIVGPDASPWNRALVCGGRTR